MRLSEVERELRLVGWTFERQNGSHRIYNDEWGTQVTLTAYGARAVARGPAQRGPDPEIEKHIVQGLPQKIGQALAQRGVAQRRAAQEPTRTITFFGRVVEAAPLLSAPAAAPMVPADPTQAPLIGVVVVPAASAVDVVAASFTATKVCKTCRLEKPLAEFPRASGNVRDGHQSRCRRCIGESTRARKPWLLAPQVAAAIRAAHSEPEPQEEEQESMAHGDANGNGHAPAPAQTQTLVAVLAREAEPVQPVQPVQPRQQMQLSEWLTLGQAKQPSIFVLADGITAFCWIEGALHILSTDGSSPRRPADPELLVYLARLSGTIATEGTMYY